VHQDQQLHLEAYIAELEAKLAEALKEIERLKSG